ncbi:hypothetical protein K402DRAFT_244122 [Aulographum hederae CBS 113979]|uniref:Uncharacterized protein n=1 Tax=Aulographum hederae CBS 113979 TaxID=1176131 RepID=A0A6G1HAA0_9PEZI|nr:hypothetical protein K402DRAFT_244122 [Aulographum hederae CBS 113979]
MWNFFRSFPWPEGQLFPTSILSWDKIVAQAKMDPQSAAVISNSERGSLCKIGEFLSGAGLAPLEVDSFLANISALFSNKTDDMQIIVGRFRSHIVGNDERIKAMLTVTEPGQTNKQQVLLIGDSQSSSRLSGFIQHRSHVTTAIMNLLYAAEAKIAERLDGGVIEQRDG